MQTFQPQPFNGLPNNNPRPLLSGDNAKKIGKIAGGIVVLIVIAIILAAISKSYSGNLRGQASGAVPESSRVSGIDIANPQPGDMLSLPIIITGSAQSYWFNDGVFPIELYDSNNAIVASTYAIADLAPEGNRVTTFHASIDSLISQPTTRLGRVVFYKYKLRDNPANGEIASIGVDFGKLYGGVITYKNGGAVTTLKTPTKKSNAYTFGTNNSSSTQTSTSTTTTQSTSSNTSQKTVVINGIVFPAHGTLDPKYADYAEESGPDTCNDGYDNDSDKRTDSADPNCHTDGKANNIRTYIGSRDENPDDPEPPIPANPTAEQTKTTTGSTTGKPASANNTGTTTTGSPSGCNADIWGVVACNQ